MAIKMQQGACRALSSGIANVVGGKQVKVLDARLRNHCGLDLDHPRTSAYKVSWIELNTDQAFAARRTDKREVRGYVAEKNKVRSYVEDKGCGKLLIDLYGYWGAANDVDFGSPPDRFALKRSHGCEMNILCRDKASSDPEVARRELDEWMGMNWGMMSAEPHFSAISRQIICEQFVEEPLLDFKFYCFIGVPTYYYNYVSVGLDEGPTAGRISFINMDGTRASFARFNFKPLEKPVEALPFFGEMERVTCDPSMPFKFARIDVIVNPECQYFSEVTLMTCAGMMPIRLREWNLKLGDLLEF